MKYEINGKMEDEVAKIKGIQDLVGIKAKNIYRAETEEELDERMSEMDLIDLQRLAVSCGISGGGTRMVLKAKIRNEFSKFLRGGSGFSISKGGTMKLKGRNKKEREKEVMNLMTEGLR